jgi:hypothetical protein
MTVPAIVTVVDAKTNAPICDATVTTDGPDGTVTEDSCTYRVSDAKSRTITYDVSASASGYQPGSAKAVRVGACPCESTCPTEVKVTIALQPIVVDAG